MKYSLFVLTLVFLTGGCAVRHHISLDALTTANQLYEAGDYKEALSQYEDLVRTTPKDGALWFRLGNCYMRTGQPDSAIDAYRNALLREPEMGKAWYNLGQIHLNMALKAYHDADQYLGANDPARELIAERYRQLLLLINDGKHGAAEIEQ